jgi:hypothetical protein
VFGDWLNFSVKVESPSSSTWMTNRNFNPDNLCDLADCRDRCHNIITAIEEALRDVDLTLDRYG